MGVLREIAYIALDGMNMDRAIYIVEASRNRVAGYKAHMLVESALEERVGVLRKHGAPAIWWDRKANDTIDTVERIAKMASDIGVDIMSVHASGEIEMMMAAKEHMDTVYAITDLTSIDGVLVERMSSKDSLASVIDKARLAAMAHVDGVVCSAVEVGYLNTRRMNHKSGRALELHGMSLIVPGTRSLGGSSHDQARSGTAMQAVKDGADKLVLGREITQAKDPVEALDQLEERLAA